MTTQKQLNTHLREQQAAVLGTRYCRVCNADRPVDGGGGKPWRCATCRKQSLLGPFARRPEGAR